MQELGRPWSYWLFLVGAVLTLQVAILVIVAETSRATEPTKPNILIILTDDQRAEGTMEIGGQRWMDSTLGLFKDEGTDFRNAFASNPACCPSRASIFSGRYSQNNYVRENSEAQGHLDHDLTMQAYLDNDDPGEDPSLDYQTGIFGKFLNDWDLNKNPPHWDRWSIGGRYCPLDVNEQGTRKRYPPSASANECTVDGHPYGTTYFTDQALGFLQEANQSMDQKPWLLYVAPHAPHELGNVPADNERMADSNPHGNPPVRYSNASVPDFTETDAQKEGRDPSLPDTDPLSIKDKPTWVQKYGDGSAIFPKPVMSDGRSAPGLRTQQLRSLLSVDDMVETIFDELQALGEADNTLALYVSDNGYMWREHGDSTIEHVWDVTHRPYTKNGVPGYQAWSYDCVERPNDNPPYYGCPPNKAGAGLGDKTKPYTESMKVPFFARWPARTDLITPGAADSSVVANVDIAPTVLDAAGVPVPANQPMDGISLLDGRRSQDEPILAQAPPIFGSQVTPWASLRTRDYQYIEYYWADPYKPVFQEYYKLEGTGADPMQLKNLFGGNGKPETGDDVPGTGDDFPNAPSVAAASALSRQLGELRRPSAPELGQAGVKFEDPTSNTHGFHYVSQDGGTLTRDPDQKPSDGGAHSGRVHVDSGSGSNVAGNFDVHLKDGDQIQYSGSFYLPPAGVVPGTGLPAGKKLMLMQWDNTRFGAWNREVTDSSSSTASTGDYGGVVVTPKPSSIDYEARLVRGHRSAPVSSQYAGTEETIGSPFTLRGGQWSNIWVWQFLSPNSGNTNPATGMTRAANYVFYSGTTGSGWVMYGNAQPNSYGRGLDRFRYGAVSYNGSQQLDVWLDNIVLSVNPVRPKGTDVQTRNGTVDPTMCPTAPTQYRPDDCDQVIYSFDKPIDPASVVSGWDGTGTRQVDLVVNGDSGEPDGNGVRNDVVEFPDIPELGKVDLGRNDYVSTIPRSFPTSLMSMSADLKTITVTLDGGSVGAGPFTAPSTMTWEGYSAIRGVDGTRAGTAADPAPEVTEGGSADREF